MLDDILNLRIVDPPLIITLCVLSIAAFVYLLFKKRTLVWWLTAILAILAGIVIGLFTVWLTSDVLDAFGGPVLEPVWFWAPATFAGIGLAIVNLWGSRWWRKLIAIVSVLLFALTGTLAVNAVYGIQATIGDFLHISTATDVDPAKPNGPDVNKGPLYKTWKAPADMPKVGKQGLVPGGIPNTISKFPARPAEIYLPPAALVDNPPRLPLVIFMMGQPGDPTTQYIGPILDAYAAQNNGLAPIALVVDQLGDPNVDPLCLDTKLGNAETYVMKDVVPWALANLNVITDRAYTTIAGYSNGGECAIYFGAKYPEPFGNILAISAEEYQSADNTNAVLGPIFGGDQKAYEAVWPITIMNEHGPYTDTWAVFTAGQLDPNYIVFAQHLGAAAEKVKMVTTVSVIPGADHIITGLNGGLQEGFKILYPRLGLSAGPPAG